MKYTIKNNKNDIRTIETDFKPVFLKTWLSQIYQNSKLIANELRETTKWETHGCRDTALYRQILHRLGIEMEDFTILNFDKLMDDSKCWAGNILHAEKMINAINLKFKKKLKWAGFKSPVNPNTVISSIDNNIPLCIHMPSLINEKSHYINVDGYLIDEHKNIYLSCHETFWGYDGYLDWCDITAPRFFEIIY